jgi:CBS domain-containing protein
MTEKKDWHKATLGDKATIREAIKKLSASSLQIILVIEENNSLLGTITDGDIRRAILRGSTLDSNLEDLMNKDPLVVSSDITKDSVLHLMNHNGLNAIPHKSPLPKYSLIISPK